MCIIDFLKDRLFLVTWISIILYIFFYSIEFYQVRKQFRYLRNMLGLGFCISRGAATVLNISCAIVLLPLCKKLNQIFYAMMTKICPALFFFWLENSKKFHMSVGLTITIFSVLHSGAHFVNIWNIFRNNVGGYRMYEQLGFCISRGAATVLNISCAIVLLPLCKKLNQIFYAMMTKICPALFFFWLENSKKFHMSVGLTITIFSVLHSGAHFVNIWNIFRNNVGGYRMYEQESLISLFIQPVATGILMLIIILLMSVTSLRTVRRNTYNTFWYIHQCYFLFLVMLLIHPLSGALKEEIILADSIDENRKTLLQVDTTDGPRFQSIQSSTWTWMAFPLTCFGVDLCWRLMSRNRSKILLKKVEYFPGRVISLTMERQNELLRCRPGQYVLLQCQQISLIEWHPFTVVKISNKKEFSVWIRVKGDWTKDLEKSLYGMTMSKEISLLLDGPYSSPMEKIADAKVAICVAAGVGITPYVSILQSMFEDPRSNFPGRLHLIWIVRHEHELTWMAELLNKTMIKLINSNKPDRLHVELYVTYKNVMRNDKSNVKTEHIITFNETTGINHVVKKYNGCKNEENKSLLTPSFCYTVQYKDINTTKIDQNYRLSNEYPLLNCRLRRGRPSWEILFKIWTNLYPNYHLQMFCCGPKNLSSYLKRRCIKVMHRSSTKLSFISEGFS